MAGKSNGSAVPVTAKAKEKVTKTVETARERLQGVAGDVQERYKQVSDDVRRGAEKASEELRHGAKKASEELRHGAKVAQQQYEKTTADLKVGYDRARQQAQGFGQDVSGYVNENPGKSVLIAAAAGFLVGLLFRGSRSHEE